MINGDKPLKAWTVGEDGEGHCVVVFHNHGLAARREGASELGYDFEDVECSRSKEFDQFAHLGYVPAGDLIAHGWWFECNHCCGRVTEDELENAVCFKYTVFCSQECVDAHDENVARQNHASETFQLELEALRPDLQFYEFNGRWPWRTLSAKFKFPGSKYGGSVREDNQVKDWFMANYDRPIWNIYEVYRGGAGNTQSRTMLAMNLIALDTPRDKPA
jgi:hypothetical protein